MSAIDNKQHKTQPINIKFENGDFCDRCGHRIENPKRLCCNGNGANGWEPADDTRYGIICKKIVAKQTLQCPKTILSQRSKPYQSTEYFRKESK